MSVRRRLAAGLGRPPLVCSLGLLAAAVAVLLLPAFAFAFLCGDTGACLCQSPQPPGDYLGGVTFLDVAHGWLAAGPLLLTIGCGPEAVIGGAQAPQGRPWTVASVGRPPPPSA